MKAGACSDQREKLAKLRQLAGNLSRSAQGGFDEWLMRKLAIIEEGRREILSQHDALVARLFELDRQVETMQSVASISNAELAAKTQLLADYDMSEARRLRGFRRFFRRPADPSIRDRFFLEKNAARDRHREIVADKSEIAVSREQMTRRLRVSQERLPQLLVELNERREKLGRIRSRLDREPDLAFCGDAIFDSLLAGMDRPVASPACEAVPSGTTTPTGGMF